MSKEIKVQDSQTEVETESIITPGNNDFLIVEYRFTFLIYQDAVQKSVWDLDLKYRKPDGSTVGQFIHNLSEASVMAIQDQLRKGPAYFNSSLPNNGGIRFFK